MAPPVSDHPYRLASLGVVCTRSGAIPVNSRRGCLTMGRQHGVVDTEGWSHLTTDEKKTTFEQQSRILLVGVDGVPFFVIDGRYGISGAQPADAVLQTLDKAWSEHSPLTLVASEGSAPSQDGVRVQPSRQRPLGQRLCQPVFGVPAVVECGHLLVPEGRIQPAGFDEVVAGVQAQY